MRRECICLSSAEPRNLGAQPLRENPLGKQIISLSFKHCEGLGLRELTRVLKTALWEGASSGPRDASVECVRGLLRPLAGEQALLAQRNRHHHRDKASI